MMHGWEKSPLHTFLIPRTKFQKQKGEVCSVFKRRGYLPSGDYFRCVSSTWVKVSSLCPEALNQSPTPVLGRFFYCLVLGSCMLLVQAPILRLLDHSMQHLGRHNSSFMGVALWKCGNFQDKYCGAKF